MFASLFTIVQQKRSVDGSSHSPSDANVILQTLTVLGEKVEAELGYILTLLRWRT